MLAEFIKDLRELGVELRCDGDRVVCDAPKGVLTETLRSEIRGRKDAIVKFLNETIEVESTEIPLVPVLRHSRMPLTRTQERLLFIDQLDPNKSFYNLPGAFRLAGKLDIGALERSLNEIVRRHEILRATYHWEQGVPVQQINPSFVVNLPIISFVDRPPGEREAAMISFLETEGDRPFNLQEGPLVRAALIELADTEHVLFFMTHHVIWDGWSFDILLSELAALYTAYVKGSTSPLPELPIQYVDFAVWHRQWMAGKRLQRELAYWHEQLKGELPVLQMPTDFPRPPRMTYNGAREWFSLSQETLTALSALSRKEGATLFMLLLAAFKTLLHRYTGQEDILVGTPIQGRTRPEIENLIGFFVNTLVLRTHVESTLNFRELLARVRSVCLGAYSHSHAPFEVLVNEHETTRDPSRTPLTQTFFTYQDTGTRSPMMGDISVKSVIRGIHQVETDLSLWVRNYGDRLDGAIDYRTDLFDASTIKRMLTHFETLLISILENPNQKISHLNIIPQAERNILLNEWSHTSHEYGATPSIQQLFETRVSQSPEATAVIFGDQQLSYRELNRRANQLAHFLHSLEMGPECLVGMCTDRSGDMLVGMLGILKAGAAYLPLDPSYPNDRLSYMLEDGRVAVLLTQRKWIEHLPEHRGQVVFLDSDWEKIAPENQPNPPEYATPENLAYVIYTSGSTGKPKGVMVSRRSLVNFTRAAIHEYGINASDRVLQFASYGFDVTVEEIFPYLVAGGTVVMRTEEMLATIPSLLQGSRDYALTVLDLPTAYWHQLTYELATNSDLALPETLRLVIFGGEEASPKRVAMWQSVVGAYPQLINTYGPTETTVVATAYRIPESITISQDVDDTVLQDYLTTDLESDIRLPVVPIGRPLNTYRLYVLDPNLQPAPIGVPGELYIGGVCVARGYLYRPDLTEQRFILDPFCNSSQSRLYKTGDLVRFLPDGNLLFLGRIDNQVKLRGFRIELGEIEDTLSHHPSVKAVCVKVIEPLAWDKRLVAYVVSQDEQPGIDRELVQYLKTKLPNYMIPQHIVELDHFPLTPNGKIDTKALPTPSDSVVTDDEEYHAPETEMEEKIAVIWKEVLGINQIGIHDNFFNLGGHSLLSMQAISKIEGQIGVRLDPFIFVTENLGQISIKCEEYISNARMKKENNDALGSKLFKKIKSTLLWTGS